MGIEEEIKIGAELSRHTELCSKCNFPLDGIWGCTCDDENDFNSN